MSSRILETLTAPLETLAATALEFKKTIAQEKKMIFQKNNKHLAFNIYYIHISRIIS